LDRVQRINVLSIPQCIWSVALLSISGHWPLTVVFVHIRETLNQLYIWTEKWVVISIIGYLYCVKH